MTCLVLAPPHNLPVLRTLVVGSGVPRLLPATILSITRRIVWPITGALLLVAPLRHDEPHMHFSPRLHAIPRPPAIFHTRLHLVTAEPGYPAELPGSAGIHCAISAMGADGLQPDPTRDNPQG